MLKDRDIADTPMAATERTAAPACLPDVESLGSAIGVIAAEVQMLETGAAPMSLWERITRHIAAGNDIAVLGRAMAVLARKSEVPLAEEATRAG